MSRPVILDAFSCAGIYADGLTEAGWEVVCLDNDPKALRHNPHETVQGDALTLLADRGFMRQFDAVHTSPPCQKHSATRMLANAQGKGTGRAVDLLPQTRALLQAGTLPWIIENVERSPLRHEPHARLCGSSFGLKVQRHRLFISEGFSLTGTTCRHAETFDRDPITNRPRPWGVYYATGDNIPAGGRTVPDAATGHELMGVARTVPWKYLCESLPPAYGRWLGAQMLEQVTSPRPVYRQPALF